MVCFLRAHKKRLSTWGIRGGSERPQPAASSCLVPRRAGLRRHRRGARCGAHAALRCPRRRLSSSLNAIRQRAAGTHRSTAGCTPVCSPHSFPADMICKRQMELTERSCPRCCAALVTRNARSVCAEPFQPPNAFARFEGCCRESRPKLGPETGQFLSELRILSQLEG